MSPVRRNVKRLLCLAVLAGFAIAAPAASADVQQLKFRFDDGRVSIGQFKGQHVVDGSATGLATLFGTIETTTGAWSAPADGLFIPTQTVENVSTPFVPVDVTADFHAAGTMSGTFDAATGDFATLDADVTAVLSAYTAGGAGDEAALLARCSVSPVPVPLASTGSLVDDTDPLASVSYDGSPFAPRGAGVATWDGFPASTSVGPALGTTVCPMVDTVADGPGGLWLAGDVEISPLPAAPVEPVATRPKARKCKPKTHRVKGKCVRTKARRG
jgi:hypothetical protein